ncbi:allophanate hydrolase [Shouchella sp. JSM 1781072]|uniref:allophanate hydrolase n=1 Tax=Shouchella sp. JSM 1781072 TaxID=3344581 RepID=UPI0035C223EA
MKKMTIEQLTCAYREGRTTPEDVITELIAKSEETSGYNVWITPPTLERIKPFLQQLAYISKDAPLWGIPFAVKDNMDVLSLRTTAGCEAYAYFPDETATTIQRLINAGAIPVGKTNLDQFATGLVGTRSPYGETKHAYEPNYISGGSSSGSAVAVALGLVPFALGTDTAGSGRVPASLHGLYGFKPSLGAWSTAGVVPACESIDCVTVFTHTIKEMKQVDAVVRGFDEKAPYSKHHLPLKSSTPTRYLVPEEESLTFFGVDKHGFKQSWADAVQKLRHLGKVETFNPKQLFEASALLYEGPLVAERWAAVGDFIDEHPEEVFPVTKQVIETAKTPQFDAANLFSAQHRLQAIKRQVERMLDEESVLVMPTNGGTYSREQVREDPIQTNSQMGLYTNHCNLLDLCALAAPAGKTTNGFPFGISFFALHHCEDLIVGAAEAFTTNNELTQIAVCGLHMQGFPLEWQMHAHQARLIETTRTAPTYRLYQLPTEPAKPGLVREESGESIEVEVWEMPTNQVGSFLSMIPAPLGLGTIQLESERAVVGFLCEASAVEHAVDLTAYGSWRAYANAQKIKG